MKRIAKLMLVSLVALLLSIGVLGCSQDSSTQGQDEGQEPTTTESSPGYGGSGE